MTTRYENYRRKIEKLETWIGLCLTLVQIVYYLVLITVLLLG